MITPLKIKRTPIIGDIAQIVYPRLNGTWKLNPSYWISRIFLNSQGVAVQIGSNDGKTADPLHAWLMRKKGWSALLVEPVPFLFKRLLQTYAGRNRFAFENAVINDGSEVLFYWVSEEATSVLSDLPMWWNQLGGFSRQHIINHLPELEPFIKTISLRGLTLTGLLELHALKKLDLLHIDTEGADFMILKQLDLEKFRPCVILYECKHLTEIELTQSVQFLQSAYALFKLGGDILAINKDSSDAMRVTAKPLRDIRMPHH